MKILYILGAYKPRASANGLCSDNIIKNLSLNGHSVTVLANKMHGVLDGEVNNEGIQIFRVRQRLSIRLKEWGDINCSGHPVRRKLTIFLAKAINKLQLFFSIAFWPTISILTNFRFKRKAIKLQKEIGYNMVISVYTPIESLKAGYNLKKKYPEITYIAYFLDALSGGYGPKIFSNKTIRRRGMRVEDKIFSVADKIILMKSSKNFYERFQEKYLSKMYFLDIPMLLKQEVKEANKIRQNNVYKLLYVGSINLKIRNPYTLINILSVLDREDISCEFVGTIDCMWMFDDLKKKMGERLIFSPFMPHGELKKKFEEADFLVNIGNSITTMVPSKIFEYMSYGKPIIATYDIVEEPSKKYLESYPEALLLFGKNRAEENVRLLGEFIEQSHEIVFFETIKSIFKLNLPQTFTDCIMSNEELNDKVFINE
jgi:conserved hypothetical protein